MSEEIINEELINEELINEELVNEESINEESINDEINKEDIIEGTADEESAPGEGSERDSAPVENPKAVIEAVLFAMGNSVDIKKLADVLNMPVDDTCTIIHEMQDEYNNDEGRGVAIVELEGSVQMCTKAEMYEHLLKIATVPKHYTLSDAVLETLSIVAYKQPVTRIEIEKIRGVNCDHAVNKLLEYNLITELGRLDCPGRPLLFGTTEEFLRCFGVKSIEELPMVTSDRLDQFKKEAAEEIQMSLPI